MIRTFRFALALLVAVPLTAYASNPLIIKTDKGKVRGAYTADHQVRQFKGIPFAAPPVGNLRWQPPQPAAKWKSVRDTTQFGPRCMQANIFHDMRFRDSGPSEDCLTLNVWTPAGTKKGSLPVMVWIFGGGYMAGGTSEPRQDGQYLAHRNVVVVSMNYRLGIFGFFALPSLTAESPHHASGNYGLEDQNAALQWVQKNIRNFGGNPHNITIFGESAGSFSVSTLMASPLSRDRFQKAIGESGGAFHSGGLPYRSLEETEQKDAEFAKTAFGTNDLAKLRKLPADELLKEAMAEEKTDHARFNPVVDGWFLPESVPAIYAAGEQSHVPLLAGWNADEMRAVVTFAKPPVTAESFKKQADAMFGTNAGEFLKVYPANTDAEAVRSAGDFASDSFIVFSTWNWINAQVHTGDAPVYHYRLDLVPPADKFHPAGTGAFHSDDIEYVFGTLDSRLDARIRPEDYKLSNEIGEYWTNFARTGNPNGEGLPNWPTYDPADHWQTMHLNTVSEARPAKHRARYKFLLKVWGTPAK
ncbi:MAG TPA: carboxylesterase/lipase family protein [Acidobacteriaceae bacterium]|nr:carboxylesterase/lipase family protein [Acidobacteriaceae bacterium]